MMDARHQDVKAGATFLARMLPGMMAGMDFKAAGEDVLRRDRELAALALEDSEVGCDLRKELMRSVHEDVRASKSKGST